MREELYHRLPSNKCLLKAIRLVVLQMRETESSSCLSDGVSFLLEMHYLATALSLTTELDMGSLFILTIVLMLEGAFSIFTFPIQLIRTKDSIQVPLLGYFSDSVAATELNNTTLKNNKTLEEMAEQRQNLIFI